MKRLVSLSVVFAAAVAMTSCGGAKSFGKMANGLNKTGDASEMVTYNSSEEILTLVNGEVETEISVNFPAEYFNPNVIVKVTPVVVFEGGELPQEPYYYQGADVENNYKVITDAGAAITETITIPYSEDMRLSDLQLRFEFKNAKKEEYAYYMVNANTGALLSDAEDTILSEKATSAEAAAIRRACGVVVAKGVNTLQEDFCFAGMMDDMANDYKAVLTSVSKADVKYAINSSRVNSSSMKGADIEAFKNQIEANKDDVNTTQAIYANGYASPDGPEKFNDKLSNARSESASKAMASFLKDMGLEADVAAYGEDWDGFKELVQASNIQDKNLILQVLSLYDSSLQREAEIKNLASVYTELKNEILPALRRAQMINNISVKGKTDAEMMVLVDAKNYAELTLEEMLHLSESVIESNEVKADVLSYAAKKYNDARAYNNLGVVYAMMGDDKASMDAFNLATRNGASDVTINKNLVLANLSDGDVAEAKKYTGDKVSSAAVSAIEGNYAPATTAFEGYNAAVAYTLSENYAAAKSALEGKTCPCSNYLRGVIASAEGDVTNGIAYITKAIAANPELAEKAKTDVNLANLVEGGLKL